MIQHRPEPRPTQPASGRAHPFILSSERGAGILAGPSVLDIARSDEQIDLLAALGIAVLLFLVGLLVLILVLLILLFLSRFIKIQKVEQFNIVFAAERPHAPEETHYAYNFYAFYARVMGPLIKPRATAFWDGVSEWSHTMGSTLRVLYSGNGQTYALYVMFYVVMIYIAVGGM